MPTVKHDIAACEWSQGHLRFRLVADDPQVVARACAVLRFWLGKATASSMHPETLTATVTTADGEWTYQGMGGFTAARCHDIATVIRMAETDAAMAVLQRTEHFTSVHGALLARGQDAVLIVGPSQSGKSTTACALWSAGWQLLADDVTLLDTVAAAATPLLRRVSLRHGSRELLGDDFWRRMHEAESCDETPEGYLFHPDEVTGKSRARDARLRAIIFLNRLNAPPVAPAGLSPLLPAQALMALAPYTNLAMQGDMGLAMSRLGPLLNQVPCYDMGRGAIPDMTASIESLLPEGTGVR